MMVRGLELNSGDIIAIGALAVSILGLVVSVLATAIAKKSLDHAEGSLTEQRRIQAERERAAPRPHRLQVATGGTDRNALHWVVA